MALVHAHRGAPCERPENTLPSFERALELGADALETDLHRTADGRIVLSHDPTLTRGCGVPLVIRTSLFDDVRSCDAGYGFVAPDGARPFAGRGIRVPTLDELLDAFPDERYPGVVDRIWPTADRQKATVEVRVKLGRKDDRLRPEMGVRIVFRAADAPECPAAMAKSSSTSAVRAAGQASSLAGT
jgi:glycerophosphoryl diester phosphodiesterase